jgi:predicted Zn-dependent peptidase
MVALSVLAASSRADGLEVPELHETTLQNGLRVVLIEKPTVPMITIEAWIEAGAIADTPETSGLAALTVESIRKGAGDLDAAAFASTLDGLGARFSTSITAEAARVHLDLLAADAAHGLDLVADALLRPRFDEEEVTRLAAQLADAIRERKDTPRLVLRDYHLAHVYGDHPLGNPVQGTESTLPRLGADDVRDFHRGHYGADRTLLVVAGDLDATAMLAEVRARFDAMPLAEAPRAALPPEPIDPGPRVLVVNDLDTPQSAFMIGAPGPGWDSPDLPAVMVVRTLFGGRFTSRLNTALRIESGLTYSASYTMERYRSTGWGAIYSFTATETTEEAITRALAELDRLHEEGISEEELASAKAYILGQTPYEYETADDLAGAVAELVFMGRGRAYLDELFARVDAVTVADCEKAIEREFSRDGMVITVAGRGDEIESALAGLGPVARRENRDPGFALR